MGASEGESSPFHSIVALAPLLSDTVKTTTKRQTNRQPTCNGRTLTLTVTTSLAAIIMHKHTRPWPDCSSYFDFFIHCLDAPLLGPFPSFFTLVRKLARTSKERRTEEGEGNGRMRTKKKRSRKNNRELGWARALFFVLLQLNCTLAFSSFYPPCLGHFHVHP